MPRYALFLVGFLAASYSVATYGQVLHDPHVIHDTLNYGSGGGSGGGNANNANTANYATNAGNANTANYATSSGSSSNATNAGNANTANYATSSGSSSNANNAGNANTANYATSSGSSSNANNANTANTANYATSSGSSSNANNANNAAYASNANIANYATNAGNAATATNATNAANAGASNTAQYVIAGGNVTTGPVNANNLTLNPGGAVNFPSTSKLTDTSNGVFQFTNAAGAFATLLLGGTTSTTGVQLIPTNTALTLKAGDGTLPSNMQFSTSVIYATNYLTANNAIYMNGGASTAAAPFIRDSTSSNTGVYWPSHTSLGFSTAGLSALVLDANQNATFASTGNVTIPHGLTTPTVVSLSAATTLTAAQCGAQIFSTGSTAFTVTLPTTPTTGCPFVLTNLATATLTVQGNAANTATITGSSLTSGTQRTLGSASSSINTIEVIWNGSGWNIIQLVGTVQ